MNNVSKIFGIRAVMEALKSEKTLDKVFVQKGLRGELFQELEHLLRKKEIKLRNPCLFKKKGLFLGLYDIFFFSTN